VYVRARCYHRPAREPARSVGSPSGVALRGLLEAALRRRRDECAEMQAALREMVCEPAARVTRFGDP
jgi:hypothetical protein